MNSGALRFHTRYVVALLLMMTIVTTSGQLSFVVKCIVDLGAIVSTVSDFRIRRPTRHHSRAASCVTAHAMWAVSK